MSELDEARAEAELDGPWVRLASGGKCWLNRAVITGPFDVGSDVFRPLSRIHRWAGQLPGTWTVAHHSLLVADIAATLAWENGMESESEMAVAGLLHDAHEAITGDIPTPVKQLLGVEVYALQARIQLAIEKRLGVRTRAAPPAEVPVWTIRRADRLALFVESQSVALWQDIPAPDEHVDTITRASTALAALRALDLTSGGASAVLGRRYWALVGP